MVTDHMRDLYVDELRKKMVLKWKTVRTGLDLFGVIVISSIAFYTDPLHAVQTLGEGVNV